MARFVFVYACAAVRCLATS